MKSFKDTLDRDWTISITVDAIRRVRSMLDIDLLTFIEGNLLQKLIADPVLLCDVIYVICKREADERRISDEDFGKAMAGDVIEHATKALLEDLVDFSPSPKTRANLRQILERTFDAMDKAQAAIETRINTLDVDKIVNQALEHVSDPSGSVPDSSASIPVPSP